MPNSNQKCSPLASFVARDRSVELKGRSEYSLVSISAGSQIPLVALCEKSVSPGTKLTRSVREYTWPQKSTVFAILVAYDTWDAAQAHRYHQRAHYAHGKVASEEQLHSQQPIRPVHEATTRPRARAVWHVDVYQRYRSDARIALASQPFWLFCQMATRQEDVLRLRHSAGAKLDAELTLSSMHGVNQHLNAPQKPGGHSSRPAMDVSR